MRGGAIVLVTLGLAGCDDVLGAEFDDPGVETKPATEEELVATLCQKIVTLTCPSQPTETQCLASLNGQITEADKFGCRKDLRKYLTCANESPVKCKSSGDKLASPTISEACDPFQDSLSECTSEDQCSQASGGPDSGVSCFADCGEYGAECVESPGGFTCECSEGPNQGTTFGSEDCLDIRSLVNVNCR